MQKQLFLIKRGGFSYSDVDTMPIYELDYFYETLDKALKETPEEPNLEE
jgi:hypothetical protein